ncbi:hypothetical protein ColLi_13985 [Colletotrichum liriopes]|uniref:Uncharacterized protein n=1 Tax=Colletotrichum liriopes TaxID=708192 RepID=A0AA37H1T8_9PEZI|nr:hypothetical protein ColLi_13985 [Colletotrichum liriopes]
MNNKGDGDGDGDGDKYGNRGEEEEEEGEDECEEGMATTGSRRTIGAVCRALIHVVQGGQRQVEEGGQLVDVTWRLGLPDTRGRYRQVTGGWPSPPKCNEIGRASLATKPRWKQTSMDWSWAVSLLSSSEPSPLPSPSPWSKASSSRHQVRILTDKRSIEKLPPSEWYVETMSTTRLCAGG